MRKKIATEIPLKKYANMAEFAAELKLSRSTVSYILNGTWQKRNISPKTVQRVKDYARKVNFVPNFFGRAIRGDVQSDAALLLPVNAYAHHREAFFRLLNTLTAENLKYLVLPVSPELDAPQDLLEKLVAYNVRCALLVAYPVIRDDNAPVWLNLVRATPGIEWLFYDFSEREAEACGFAGEPNVGWVGFDRRKGLQDVCRYVADCGFSTLLTCGFVIPAIPELPLRCIEVAPGSYENWHGWRFDHGASLADALEKYRLGHPADTPQAVFINDDQLSAEVIFQLLKRGYRVPEDFAFISWDGLEISRYFIRSLTTVAIPHCRMIEAAETFLSGRQKLGRHEFPPEIREGVSMPAPQFRRS